MLQSALPHDGDVHRNVRPGDRERLHVLEQPDLIKAQTPDPHRLRRVDRYTSDPGQFVRDVLESNRQLTVEVRGYREEVNGLRRALEDVRDKDRKFRNALARWFVDIMAAFEQNQIDMPYPREADSDILADVIPSALEATQPRRPYRRPE